MLSCNYFFFFFFAMFVSFNQRCLGSQVFVVFILGVQSSKPCEQLCYSPLTYRFILKPAITHLEKALLKNYKVTELNFLENKANKLYWCTKVLFNIGKSNSFLMLALSVRPPWIRVIYEGNQMYSTSSDYFLSFIENPFSSSSDCLSVNKISDQFSKRTPAQAIISYPYKPHF